MCNLEHFAMTTMMSRSKAGIVSVQSKSIFDFIQTMAAFAEHSLISTVILEYEVDFLSIQVVFTGSKHRITAFRAG